MRVPRYCIYNQTNECFLSLGTRPGCNPFAFFKRWFRKNSSVVDEGYWLAPPRRIMTLGFLSFHDLLYLDDRQKVVGAIESFFLPRLAPKRARAGSMLVLPEHTIQASSTQVGNQLVICSPEEMESWLRAKVDIKSDDPKPMPQTKALDAASGAHSVSRHPDKRLSSRTSARSLCAHYENRVSMTAPRIRDVSVSGLFLVTPERWPVGTRVTMTLELMDAQNCGNPNPVLAHLTVARWGADGLGLEFLSSSHDAAELQCESLLVN